MYAICFSNAYKFRGWPRAQVSVIAVGRHNHHQQQCLHSGNHRNSQINQHFENFLSIQRIRWEPESVGNFSIAVQQTNFKRVNNANTSKLQCFVCRGKFWMKMSTVWHAPFNWHVLPSVEFCCASYFWTLEGKDRGLCNWWVMASRQALDTQNSLHTCANLVFLSEASV